VNPFGVTYRDFFTALWQNHNGSKSTLSSIVNVEGRERTVVLDPRRRCQVVVGREPAQTLEHTAKPGSHATMASDT